MRTIPDDRPNAQPEICSSVNNPSFANYVNGFRSLWAASVAATSKKHIVKWRGGFTVVIR
jgi:hypothetical protein